MELINTNFNSGRLQTQMVMYDLSFSLEACVWQWDVTILRNYFWFPILPLCLTKPGSISPFPFLCCVQVSEWQTKTKISDVCHFLVCFHFISAWFLLPSPMNLLTKYFNLSLFGKTDLWLHATNCCWIALMNWVQFSALTLFLSVSP